MTRAPENRGRPPHDEGLGFVDMLLIAALGLLVIALAAAAFFVLHGGF